MKFIYEPLTIQLVSVESILPLTFLILFFVIFLMRRPSKETPLSSLHKKFGTGEINAVEFEHQQRLLLKEEDLKMKSFFLSRT